jgi:hypothetical protein
MRYSARTSASPTEALMLARAAFGDTGAGLRISDLTLTSARFASDVGFIAFEAERLPDGATEVVLETREFDAEARRFLLGLPRHSALRAAWRRVRSKLKPSTTP